MQYGLTSASNSERKFGVDMSTGRIYTMGELLYDEQSVSVP